MDDIEDFFDFSKPFERHIVSGGYVNGRVQASEFNFEITKREKLDESYAKIFVEAEKQQIFEQTWDSKPSTSYINDCADFDMDNETPNLHKKDDPVYLKYTFDGLFNTELPIADYRVKILTEIRDNRVVVLQGDTGCGKTTQVPQYILNDAYRRGEYCNIVCTQPRRIAAISIAQRVCSESNWDLGSIVGYQVALHANVSDDTRLLFCTTGILLQKLIKAKDMSTYTHVILDEVHERDQDMDFLLILIRRFLATNSSHVKVILMSATIDSNEFSEYFKIKQHGTIILAPTIKVDNRRLYSVNDFYIDQLEKLESNTQIDYDEPGISDDTYRLALKIIIILEKIDTQAEPMESQDHKPSILIFLPGINEIDKMEKTLLLLKDVGINIMLMPIQLHSMISTDEQQKVFRRPPLGVRKVILSTNIAESSITVPDVKYVIDFCLMKSLVTDTSTNLTKLMLHWAAQSNCKQRAGRAGRVANGRVYRLVSKNFYDNIMDKYAIPEMVRCPLENVVLKAKQLDIGTPPSILALAMTPPKLEDIRNTILILKEAGALYKTVNGSYEIFDGDLTYIGRIMATLPLDIRISRLIVFGYMFSVLEDSIIMAAGLNVKSIFEFPYNNALAAYSQKLAWSDGSGSDLFAILKAYKVWCSLKEQNNFDDEDTEKSWARRYFINTRSMREMHLLVTDIKQRLMDTNIIEGIGSCRVNWLDKEKTIILKTIIAGAFYPNYFFRPNGNMEIQRLAFQTLDGYDPCNTVYFSGFDSKYIGQLYIHSIKDLFKTAAIAAKNIQVRFSEGSQKVFITFVSDCETEDGDNNFVVHVPGRVRPEVYKAVKMRYLNCPRSIKVANPSQAVPYAESKGLGVMSEGKWFPKRKQIRNPELVVLPLMHTHTVRGNITHVEHCHKFYFRPLSEEEKFKEITNDLNKPNSDIMPFNIASEISKNMMVAAPFSEYKSIKQYHRAKVIKKSDRYENSVFFLVLFIDYGNSEVIDFKKLRKLGSISNRLIDLPSRVFECCLTEVQPSSINCPDGKWPEEAIELLQKQAEESLTEIEVYSVVNGVASVFIKSKSKTLNEILVEKGFAQYSEENYMSKTNHDTRMRKQKLADFNDDEDLVQNENYLRSIQGEELFTTNPPSLDKCRTKLDLRGPFSPLEARIFAATRIGGWKSVSVEQVSVNSVLLDTDPQDNHERLIVAASVTENYQNNSLVARNTTLMPNIHGFAPLMGLIFCPTMEIRRDLHKNKYINVLTGLGCDASNKALFEEHDIVFNLDAEIVPADLELINQIRYSMDTLLYTESGDEHPKISKHDRDELNAKIKSLIIKLLENPRKYIEVYHDSKRHKWGQNSEEDLLQTTSIYRHRSVFPFHSGLRLYQQPFDRIKTLRAQCKELHKLSQHDVTIPNIKCKLCEITLDAVVHLRIHLLSKLHRDREDQIGYTQHE